MLPVFRFCKSQCQSSCSDHRSVPIKSQIHYDALHLALMPRPSSHRTTLQAERHKYLHPSHHHRQTPSQPQSCSTHSSRLLAQPPALSLPLPELWLPETSVLHVTPQVEKGKLKHSLMFLLSRLPSSGVQRGWRPHYDINWNAPTLIDWNHSHGAMENIRYIEQRID